MTKELITKHIVAIILIAGVSGYGGYYYGSKKVASSGQGSFARGQFGANGQMGQSGQRQGQVGQRVGARGGNLLTGEVLKMDDKSVTIKLNDGGSKTVYFTASTSVDKSVSGAVTDLKAGERVLVNGKANSDGSVNADLIQIRQIINGVNQEPARIGGPGSMPTGGPINDYGKDSPDATKQLD